ncbi:MAG: GTPase HflX [Desulfobacteraceae bacterium]|nr:GTPase HflX [Desulfobacteraceae bacterium]
MGRLSGNITGLKPNQVRRIGALYRRRLAPETLCTPELANELGPLSAEIHRQLGLLVDRRGRIVTVMVGDAQQIVIPELEDFRAAPGRLRGLRCLHTHLKGEALTRDDLTDLDLLRLDLMAALSLDENGQPVAIHVAHVLPGHQGVSHQVLPPLSPYHPDIDCLELVRSLEAELGRLDRGHRADGSGERAVLVSVTTAPRRQAVTAMDELRQLAHSCGLTVVSEVIQQRRKIDPSLLLGKGKLQELAIEALQRSATLLVFDQELNPSQSRAIADAIEMKVIDRTQLILDIFAQRAQSREGKLQVELAQLRYRLPRLVGKNRAMSRLAGGIGGRGPGETQLEIDRRRARERIGRIEASLEQVRSRRRQQKALRQRKAVPVISLVGYTNAGKSTLLNTLTHSRVPTADRLFATLDPSSRRLRFPRDLEVILTDTVGFIRDLPRELRAAFQATLEELALADLLLHVIDASDPECQARAAAVDAIIEDLELQEIPLLRVLNKQDRLDAETLAQRVNTLGGVPVCARDAASLTPLLERMQTILEPLARRLAAGVTPKTSSPEVKAE